jgi:hypothetical protein
MYLKTVMLSFSGLQKTLHGISSQNIQRAQKIKHQKNNLINKWANELDTFSF